MADGCRSTTGGKLWNTVVTAGRASDGDQGAGYQGMEAGFDSASEQYSRIYHTSELQDADTKVAIYDADGSEILSWTVPKEFNSIVISAPEIKEDGTYTIKVGGQEDIL